MDDPLVRKMRHFIDLSDAELKALDQLRRPCRKVPANTIVVHENTRSDTVFIFRYGWAIRHRKLAEGRQQIVNFILPGDFCDPTIFVTRRTTHGITTISPAKITEINPHQLFAVLMEHPRLAAVLWWFEAQEEALLREHIVAVGRRTAYQRVCYLFWETDRRLKLIGQTVGHSFAFPVTQRMLADALGLTPVHVNRVLRQLEDEGHIKMRSGGVTIVHPKVVQAIAEVKGVQLHHESAPEQLRQLFQHKTL